LTHFLGHPFRPFNTFDLIKLSIYLAVNTGVDTIFILGDFNKDQRNRKNSKIADILIKYDMIHLTNDATDVSESSSLVIYLDISNNPNNVDHIHVEEPFVPKISLSYLKMCSLHDIAEILLKLVLSINQSINQERDILGTNGSSTCI
jgi:hypothetical protein